MIELIPVYYRTHIDQTQKSRRDRSCEFVSTLNFAKIFGMGA